MAARHQILGGCPVGSGGQGCGRTMDGKPAGVANCGAHLVSSAGQEGFEKRPIDRGIFRIGGGGYVMVSARNPDQYA